MKTRKTKYLLIVVAACGLLVTSCNKVSSPAGPLTAKESIKAENSDVQDAVADKNEQEIDNTLDQLQVLNYSASSLKDAFVSGTRTITVDHPDSTTFPKVITIVYSDFPDSTASESFVKNGEIDITVTLAGANKQLVTRAQVFKDFSITTDSTTVTVSGTRTVTRTAIIPEFNGFTSLRLVITDNIVADLNYAITKTGISDSLKFTRVVSKVRNAYLHYTNVGGATWQTINFRNTPAKDTITWYGTVSGSNENNELYTKSVAQADPITLIFYKGTPVLASGTMNYSIGESAAYYIITFKEDPDHPHMTLVTVTNSVTYKTHTFVRRFCRKFIRWW